MQMSAHFYGEWEYGQEISDGLIKRLAICVKNNRNYGGGGWLPGAFVILNHGDAMIFNAGLFLNKWEGDNLEESVKEFVGTSCDDKEVEEQVKEVLIRVCQEIEGEGLLDYKKDPPKTPNPITKIEFPKLKNTMGGEPFNGRSFNELLEENDDRDDRGTDI
jgi:hypothetical protein